MTKRANRNAWAGKAPTSVDFDPSAIRGALGKAFLNVLVSDFSRHGRAVLKRLRRQRRQDYLKLAAAFLPKEYRLTEVPLPEMNEEEFAAVLSAVRAELAKRDKEQGGDGGPAGQEPGGAGH